MLNLCSEKRIPFLQGLKFPWESAVSGREVCPEDIYGQQEIHINGDVTLAFQHYLYLTEVSSSAPSHQIALPCVVMLTEFYAAGPDHVQRGTGQPGDIWCG